MTGFDDGKRLDFKVLSGPVPFEVRQTFEPTAEGTRVQIVIEGEPGGFFRLAEPLVARAVRRQIELDSGTLTDLLEAGLTESERAAHSSLPTRR